MNLIWLPASLLGGLFQAWRTALQQRIRSELNVSGAGLVRYLYGLPVAAVMTGLWLWSQGLGIPPLSAEFFALAFLAATAQMAGTIFLITAFGHGGFVVGTAFSKTEAMQAALVMALFFGDHLPVLAWIGILSGAAGVLTLVFGNAAKGDARPSFNGWLRALKNPAALYGIGAGTMFAGTAIAVKYSTMALPDVGLVGSAFVALTCVMAIQSLLHSAWIIAFDRATIKPVLRSWRTSGQVGLLSALGSACWFTGFAAAPAALVRVVGQVEVIFTLGFARFYLREPVKRHEIIGLLLVSAGVILALLSSF